MYFHWLCKHRLGKDRIDLFKEYPSYEQPEEIEVDEFIRKIGTKEIQLDLVPKSNIEPCYSTSDEAEDDRRRVFSSSESDIEQEPKSKKVDVRRVFDSSSESDIEPDTITKDEEEPKIIVTIAGNRRMYNVQNEERIVRIIDSDEDSSHDPTRRNSRDHVIADREVSESSHSKE